MVEKKEQKRRHLGKGLDSLLGPITNFQDQKSLEPSSPESPKYSPDKELQSSMRTLLIEAVKPNPYQPRTTYDDGDLRELADSM